MNRAMLDFYTNVQLSSFGQVAATRAAGLTDHALSHDKVTRFLGSQQMTSRTLWAAVKPFVSWVQSPQASLLVDDTLIEKFWMDENPIICWHYDHARKRALKGIDLVSAVYYSLGTTLPVAFDLVKKSTPVRWDSKTTGKVKRVSEQTKNEIFRHLVARCARNMPFQYVLADVWYASKENMIFIHKKLTKRFVMPIKANRKVALSRADKRSGTYVTVESLFPTRAKCRLRIYVQGIDFPLTLVRRVFKNEDGSHGALYLVTDDLTLTEEAMFDLYQRRWKAEEYHKALKQNCAIAHSPARTVRTQTSHVFCSLWAFVKLELIHLTSGAPYEAIKRRLYMNALKLSFNHLQLLDPFRWSAKPVFA